MQMGKETVAVFGFRGHQAAAQHQMQMITVKALISNYRQWEGSCINNITKHSSKLEGK
jgi:hypothetical protein